MAPPVVRAATTQDLPGIADALADSFHDDPVFAHVFGGTEARRVRWLRPFFKAESARHLRDELVFTTEDHGGAALWAPPGHWMTRPRDHLRLAVPMLLGINVRIPRALRGLTGVESVHERQPPDHYYLAVLGSRTALQGKGYGTALIQPVLDRCDAEGMGAYLESSKERNIPFYRRHGFEVVEEIPFGTRGPTLWGMWRDPRPA